MNDFKQVCMYCGCLLGGQEAAYGNSTIISHGICSVCLPTLLCRHGRPLSDFLDAFPGPIFVVDAKGRIVGANTKGLEQVSKDLSSIEGQPGGVVFECKYAKLPEGCGRTVHCKTCTMRITVTKTFETGESCFQVPAFIDLADISEDMTVRFLISTEKVNDIVLLRIENAPKNFSDNT